MLHLTIDGVPHTAEPGSMLLQVLLAARRDIPHLCHDPRVQPSGGCRMCVVEIEGEPRPVSSCTTAVTEGMAVRTATPAIEALRRTNLSLLAGRYPAAAVAAEPQQPFHRLLARFGVPAGDAPWQERYADDSHPYLGVAMDRCISCNRCVRICDELQGQFVWQVWQRGERTHVGSALGGTLSDSGCVSCGACADSCPTGAIFDKRSAQQPAERWTRSTCVYCAVGCQMDVGSRDGKVVAVRPADHPVNRGHLCVKGRYAFEYNHAPDRITTPMLRDGDGWRATSWDEALDHTAACLQRIRARHGANAIGVLGSARATNEENYLAQKFARMVIGTNNVDCCARVCHTPSAKALKTMLGTGAATNAFDDIEQASCFLLCGCNPTENHPIVGARIKQAVLRGAALIVVDPRRTELAEYARLHLAVRPGANVLLFNAMAAAIIDEGLVDLAFVAHRVDGLDQFSVFARAYAPEAVSAQCGVAAADIRAAARLYATSAPAMCFHGLGMTEHTQGTEGVMTLINLALLTGNLGRPGSGINPLRGQNNVQGSAQMGCEPGSLTGAQPIAQARARFEAVWGGALPDSDGLDLMQMFDAAAGGSVKALWAFGYDVYLSLANQHASEHALRQLDCVIVQDLFLNETARTYGTVFFPAASVFERDGTFMNSDRRVQRVRQAVPPPGDARPDWWIIQQLAQRMGHARGFDFDGPEAIWNEVRAVWPAGAGLSYRRLETESLHWPCPQRDDDAHPGTPILHGDSFAGATRARLAQIPYLATPEQCDSEYPFMLMTGRCLYHFNAGTMTYRGGNAQLQASDLLDMAPADAARLGLADGARVRVRSRYGEVELPLRLSPRMKPGELFTTFHRPDLHVNRLTSPQRDRLVHTPEYKVTAVQVAPA
ncbi:MAG TPA: formate dehydrogenase subunit alpha [Burkholderiaceae bacterium]|nr:formate dehydrogenase subunit alpha [Burkholderiaceae bacterium]